MSGHTQGPWNVYVGDDIVAHAVEAGTADGACEEYALWLGDFGGEHEYRCARSRIASGEITAHAAIAKATGEPS